MMRHCVQIVVQLALAAALVGLVSAEETPQPKGKILAPTAQWLEAVEKAAPARPTADAPKRKVLVFSLFTGYNHLVIPHVDEVFKILGRKSGAFEADVTADIEALAPDRLAAYDVLVLNNNCSKGSRRNLFLDELERNKRYRDMNDAQRQAKADALEQSLLDFVAGGKGLVAIHGAPTLLNNSARFTEMVGCSFDFHPPAQRVTIRTINPDDPLVAAFKGKEPFVHTDEPYLFAGPYGKFDFHPLLAMDAEKLKSPRKLGDTPRYVAWVKSHGKGRVFYCSPSHFPESYQSPALLRFLLDGTQYASGDLRSAAAK